MAKQVYFYMTSDDELDFVEFVRSSGDASILKYVQSSDELHELKELPLVGEPFWFALLLWHKDLSPRPKLKYVREQNCYFVDETESEVIEFHRCGMDENRLVRGRIFAEMSFWKMREAPAKIVKKNDEFRKWYDRLANWIKRRSIRNSAGDFLLVGAQAFVANGGSYCQAVLGNGSTL